MEEKLLELIKLSDLLNEKQKNIYTQIIYNASEYKKLELIIRSKKDFSYIQKYEFYLSQESSIKWDDIIELFKNYILRGVENE